MEKQTLKDAHHNIIGYLETHPDGKQTGKDASFRIKGYYDPKRNETKDSSFRVVGTGNLLSALIVQG